MNPWAVFAAIVVWTVASVCLTAWATCRGAIAAAKEHRCVGVAQHPVNPDWTPAPEAGEL
jgi:hypothetical protein